MAVCSNLSLPVDTDVYLPYGKITDYPVDEKESLRHWKSRKITPGVRLDHKLSEAEIYNVICMHPKCVHAYPFLRNQSRWYLRGNFKQWAAHHIKQHPNSPKMYQIASYWSTEKFDGYGYDKEYRLISLDEYKFLKPLNKVYAEKGAKEKHRCAYCHQEDVKLLKCGGCKVLLYCNTKCQSKHWKLIHKDDCKRLRKKYSLRTPSQAELDELDNHTTARLQKMIDGFYGPKVKRAKAMMGARVARTQKKFEEVVTSEILFPDPIPRLGDTRRKMINIMMSTVLENFDKDNDKRLNFAEWKAMWKSLGFRKLKDLRAYGLKSWHQLVYLHRDLGMFEPIKDLYRPSLNSGCYGTYNYTQIHQLKAPLSLGAKEVLESLRVCAYMKSRSKRFVDDDFRERYDIYDEDEAHKHAFKLLTKLFGHAQNEILRTGPPQDKVYDAIYASVPFMHRDIVVLIYDFASYTMQRTLDVNWHRITWLTLEDDQEGLWNLYDRDRDDQHFDLFYINKQDERGYDDISIHVQICDDIKQCDKKLTIWEREQAKEESYKFQLLELMEKHDPTQKWCLGQCSAYIPTFSFNHRDHATLILKVLKFHRMNPKMCHYIYIGPGVKVELEDNGMIAEKRRVVKLFREITGSKTRYRPHAPKKSSKYHSLLNL